MSKIIRISKSLSHTMLIGAIVTVTSCCAPAAASKEDQTEEVKQINVEGDSVKQTKFNNSVPENLKEDTSENPTGDLEMPNVKMQTYTINFGKYEQKSAALNIISLFKKHNIEVLRIVKNILPDGKVNYSIQAGHYFDESVAEKSRLKYEEILAADGWDIKTEVLKEK